MADLGLALDDLRAETPTLITCSLTAFDDDVAGAAGRPGYDIIVQALSGLMSVTGEPDGEPVKAGVALLDVIAGPPGRDRHPRRAPGADAHGPGAARQRGAVRRRRVRDGEPGREPPPRRPRRRTDGDAHPNICPYQAFHGSDRPFILAAGNDRLFRRTCEVVGHADWADDPRSRRTGSAWRTATSSCPCCRSRSGREDRRRVDRGAGGGRGPVRSDPDDRRGLRVARGRRRSWSPWTTRPARRSCGSSATRSGSTGRRSSPGSRRRSSARTPRTILQEP